VKIQSSRVAGIYIRKSQWLWLGWGIAKYSVLRKPARETTRVSTSEKISTTTEAFSAWSSRQTGELRPPLFSSLLSRRTQTKTDFYFLLVDLTLCTASNTRGIRESPSGTRKYKRDTRYLVAQVHRDLRHLPRCRSGAFSFSTYILAHWICVTTVKRKWRSENIHHLALPGMKQRAAFMSHKTSFSSDHKLNRAECCELSCVEQTSLGNTFN
jgi:hypothetical protein